MYDHISLSPSLPLSFSIYILHVIEMNTFTFLLSIIRAEIYLIQPQEELNSIRVLKDEQPITLNIKCNFPLLPSLTKLKSKHVLYNFCLPINYGISQFSKNQLTYKPRISVIFTLQKDRIRVRRRHRN